MSDEAKKDGRGRPKKSTLDWAPIAETAKQASQLLGWPSTRLKQCQTAGCPAFRHGRVYIGELVAWLGTYGLDDAGIDWARELKKEQTLKLQAERAEREKRTMDFAEVQRCLQRIDNLFWLSLERTFCMELPPVLKGREEPYIAKRCREEIEMLKGTIRAALEELERERPAVDVAAVNSDTTATDSGSEAAEHTESA